MDTLWGDVTHDRWIAFSQLTSDAESVVIMDNSESNYNVSVWDKLGSYIVELLWYVADWVNFLSQVSSFSLETWDDNIINSLRPSDAYMCQ